MVFSSSCLGYGVLGIHTSRQCVNYWNFVEINKRRSTQQAEVENYSSIPS